MNELNQLLDGIAIPRMLRVRQEFDAAHIDRQDICRTVSKQLTAAGVPQRVQPGARIALTAGSREICCIDEILRSAAAFLKQLGAQPFIVPAMGSHGGATAEGQTELLAGYHITEETCGCPILSSMETVFLGKTADGQDVFLDRYAAEADGILVIGRVKAHTGFQGPYESGILKMLAIGLGKQKGADSCHSKGFGRMAENIQQFGFAILKYAKVVGALAILENAFDQTYRLAGMAPEEIAEQEPGLLQEAKALMPQILLPSCDVLVVDEVGKNFSGSGMDPNVSGRQITPFCSGKLRSQQAAVLRLSEKTHRNGYGIGAANFTTMRAFHSLDLPSMYINGLTCRGGDCCHIPCVMDSDRLAIQACIRMCSDIGASGPRIIRIANTLQIQEILVSENYAEKIDSNPRLTILDGPYDLPFDPCGNLPL